MRDEAAAENKLLGLVEGFKFGFIEGMPSVLHGEAGEGVNNLAVGL